MSYKVDFSIVDIELDDYNSITLLNLIRLVKKYENILKNYELYMVKKTHYLEFLENIRDYSIRQAITNTFRNNKVLFTNKTLGFSEKIPLKDEEQYKRDIETIINLWISYIKKKLLPIKAYIEETKVINEKKNKEKTNEYLLEKIHCTHCNEIITRNYLSRHLKTKKCLNFKKEYT